MEPTKSQQLTATLLDRLGRAEPRCDSLILIRDDGSPVQGFAVERRGPATRRTSSSATSRRRAAIPASPAATAALARSIRLSTSSLVPSRDVLWGAECTTGL